MSNTFGNVYIHFVFSTKFRESLLDSKLISLLSEHIKSNLFENYRIKTLSVNGYKDHLHVLIIHNTDYLIPAIVKAIKGESSHWINSCHLCKNKFLWQEGYGVFSVSHSVVSELSKYIEDQEKHHSSMSFNEETEKYFNI